MANKNTLEIAWSLIGGIIPLTIERAKVRFSNVSIIMAILKVCVSMEEFRIEVPTLLLILDPIVEIINIQTVYSVTGHMLVPLIVN